MFSIKPSLSCIIITHSRDITEQINSIKNQKYPKLEIIVVNDEPKRTLSFSGVLTINNEKKIGRSASRNLGVNQAQNDILVFMDEGMIPDADCLQKISKMIKKAMVLKPIVHYDMNFFMTREYLIAPSTPYSKYLAQKNPQFWSNFFAVHKADFNKYPFDESFGLNWGQEDIDWYYGQSSIGTVFEFTEKISAKINTIDEGLTLDESVAKYKQGANNLKILQRKWGNKVSEHVNAFVGSPKKTSMSELRKKYEQLIKKDTTKEENLEIYKLICRMKLLSAQEVL